MKLTKPVKKAIETFFYIAVVATMIFHYGVASTLFESAKVVESIPIWPMYVTPLMLAAGLTIFVVYPIYVKEENDS